MDSLDFSEEEIHEQLVALGYKNIPKHRLREFKQDLDELVRHGEWKSLASPAQLNPAKSQTATSQQSPPAYTKEKVSQCYLESSGEGFFLHAGQADHDRHVLTAGLSKDYGRQQGNCDSYAQHSVALKRPLPPGAPGRLQVEPDPDDTLQPPLSDSCDSSAFIPESHRGRFIKRKVLRKHKGQSLVCDESVYSEDSDAASCLEERLADLQLSSSAQRDFETEHEDVTSQSDTRTSETEGLSFSAFESYIRGMTRSHSDGDLRPKPKSFIRPVMSQQTLKKTDPVAKYFQYKQLWEMFKLPGEKDRRDLRWEIRERLAYQPPPPKPRRVYVPNTYIVPTEKKRSALRWEIRNDLANGLPPHKFSHRF
ncbi:hydrolethalus syndrome protein 1 homolog isoform X4 [Sander lucioperca]|uniref:HYLS1 centriolar and ciliogenesis associated n=1 Tax=Sander lucioperca TaxID=283035 RepID=A0A8C9Z4B2_SANLU|nr:hydrolethalus syndrome protein 1 homolog isoform X4 [Sander lucioperca]